MKYSLLLLAFISVSHTLTAQKTDIQGHRGARGMRPENSIPAFIYAVDQGVTTLEMDVVITKDGEVVVSHEPWINAEICTGPEGKSLDNLDKEDLNIYQMTYDQVRKYDCGSLEYSRFPEQQKMHVNKPLLRDVIREVERYTRSKTGHPVNYNIEIKSGENGDNVYHPAPAEFSDMVFKLIDDYLPWERVIIQSFDFRVLQYWNKTYPEVQLAALIENTRSVETNLGALGFLPRIYSPYYKLIGEKTVKELHEKGIKVIPWTVNEEKDMKQLVDWGIDGIITDYPDRAANLGLTRKQSK